MATAGNVREDMVMGIATDLLEQVGRRPHMHHLILTGKGVAPLERIGLSSVGESVLFGECYSGFLRDQGSDRCS